MAKKPKKQEVLKEVKGLFLKAKESKNPNLEIKKARKLAMKVNLKFPNNLKKRFCKHCYTYFQNDNYRVRTRNKMIIYYCKTCKRYMRFKIAKKTS
jgi:RNase P subunit RPR2